MIMRTIGGLRAGRTQRSWMAARSAGDSGRRPERSGRRWEHLPAYGCLVPQSGPTSTEGSGRVDRQRVAVPVDLADLAPAERQMTLQFRCGHEQRLEDVAHGLGHECAVVRAPL